MKKIEINIADNLSAEAEIVAIAKKLQQKSLSGSGKNKSIARIGDSVDVIDLQTVIVVNRVSTEKPIVMIKCNVCGCEYDSKKGKRYFTNYGGMRKQKSVCSTECQTFMIDNFGARVSASRKGVSTFRFDR